jgi:hypothetical protein
MSALRRHFISANDRFAPPRAVVPLTAHYAKDRFAKNGRSPDGGFNPLLS